MKRVLDILRSDGRATSAEIAAMTGLDEAAIESQVAAWERTGLIRRYKAVVDQELVQEMTGEEVITALIDVAVAPARGVGFDDIANRIARFSEVRSVYLVSGVQDLRCVITGRSLRDIADFVAQKLSTIDRVTATATHFVLKTYKEDNEVFTPPEPDRRLQVSA